MKIIICLCWLYSFKFLKAWVNFAIGLYIFIFLRTKASGFSLISMLIALSIMGFSMTALISLMVNHEKGNLTLNRKMENIRLKNNLIRTIRDTDICSCHFTSSRATAINLDTKGLGDITMASIRRSCDFSSSSNILFKSGAFVPGSNQLRVASIKVTGIKFTGTKNQYWGNLTVNYNQDSLSSILSPISVPFTFSVDGTSGTESARPIQSCWNTSVVQIQQQDNNCMTVDPAGPETKGRTLLGCGGTSNASHKHSTAFGYAAGVSSGSGNNTYLGYRAGTQHSGSQSTFVGYKAGESAGNASSNTVVGSHAGRLATGGEQVLIGIEAGEKSTGNKNVFVGYQTGQRNTSGSRNVAFGNSAGRNNSKNHDNVLLGHNAFSHNSFSYYGDGSENVVVGESSGLSSRRSRGIFIQSKGFGTFRNLAIGELSGGHGSDNVAIGYKAMGSRKQTAGFKNVAVGQWAGRNKTKGDENTYVGFRAGESGNGSNVNENTAIGSFAMIGNVGGKKNVMLGFSAAEKSPYGNGNVLVGAGAGRFLSLKNDSIYIGDSVATTGSTKNSQFIVGVLSYLIMKPRIWIRGTMTPTGNLYINDQQVAITSSRHLKKNLRPVRDVKKYVDHLIKTPLFTYEYKSKNLHPKKNRMGFISEELPESLQLRSKGQLSHPDWPSIYGYFWASIKYLYDMLEGIRKILNVEVNKMKNHISLFQAKHDRWLNKTMASKQAIAYLSTHLSQVSQELEDSKRDLRELKRDIKEQWEEIEKQFPGGWVLSSLEVREFSDGAQNE